jgi:thioredoxin reductase (NADPH)
MHYAATPIETTRCAGQQVIVVGGGNSAGQAALHLSARASHVHLVVRASTLEATMSDYLVKRIAASLRITIHLNCEVESISGDPRSSEVTIVDRHSHSKEHYRVSDIFVMIGANPNTGWLRGSLELDRSGFIITGTRVSELQSAFATSRCGVFAIGDVRSGSTKRVASAVGEGSIAVADIHLYLEELRASLAMESFST